MFLNNPAYQLQQIVTTKEATYRIYIPVNTSDYHMIRHVEATKQATYAASGANAEVIQAHLNAILDRCNQAQSFDSFKTDITSITNALMFRTKYPVDQHCGVRMGCILSFLEVEENETEGITFTDYTPPKEVKTGTRITSEDPNKADFIWQDRKEKLAFEHQELYTFFLTWGVTNVPQWSDHLNTLKDMEYLLNRRQTLLSILGNLPSDLLSQLTK